MNSFIRTLASLKLTIVLLLVIAVMLSFGTILESLRGAEAARAVYDAPWFYGLLGLFALNILAALWERWPRNRWRIGFVITHASMLVILLGALLTATSSIEGRLAMWEGESSDHFVRTIQGRDHSLQHLPFQVRLDAYEMDVYPGTERPAMFRSRVTVTDASGVALPAIIQMNHPLVHGGFSFFQSSYQIENGRRMSVLSVSKDPGQPIVFLGYGLLLLGMIVVLITRIAQFREAERAARPGAAAIPVAARVVLIAAGALALAASPSHAFHARLPPAHLVPAIGRLPVQSDGRAMPLDTEAREAVLTVTGMRRFPGADPVAMVVGWTMDPSGWMTEPIVKIDGQVAELCGLPAGTRHTSFQSLLDSPRLRTALGPALERQSADMKPAPGDKSLLRLDERIRTFDLFLRGQAIRALPAAERVRAWGVPADSTSPATYAQLEARVRPGAPAHYPSASAIATEIRYNAVDPTHIAWLLLLPAVLAAGLTLERNRWRLRWVAMAGMVLGFAVMTWGIATRWQIAGHIPASNMYESMLFLGWGVGLFGVVSLLVRNRMLVFNAAAMSALVMLLLDRLPIDPFIRPMAPVLSGTPWLAIHVPIIMVSYSTFAIATFLAHVVVGSTLFAPGRRDIAQRWGQLLYWYLLVGSILLIAGIMTGSIWAASSWGRYWGWDPKEVWSLVAFLAYMAILHARSDAQIDPFGVAVSSIVAFWTILMTYLGVNFVLASGLHSYGFGNTNLVRVLVVIALAETGFLMAGWSAHRRAIAR
jgi:cytochrome c-type biogenesis protein CcsB